MSSCNGLVAGDVPLFLYNSMEPDQAVFFPLVDIPGAVGSLYLTDSAYNGTDLLDNEGTLELAIPTTGIREGQIFGYGDNSPLADQWTQLPDKGNAFDIQTTGDNLFLYCLDGNETVFLFGFSNNGIWKAPGLDADEYGSGYSALPESLELRGSLVSAGGANCVYNGPLTLGMSRDALQEEMINPDNFNCINATRVQLEGGNGPAFDSDATRSSTMTTMLLAMTLLTTAAGVFL